MDESKTPATLPTLAEKLLAFDPARQKIDRFLASDVAKLAEKHMQDIQRLQTDGVDPKGETTSQPTRCRSMIIPFSAMVQRFMMPLSAKRRRALVATTPIEE